MNQSADTKSHPPPKLSIVVPCFNEAQGLHELHRRVTNACRDVVADNYEIVLVDDGSSDETWHRITSISKGDVRVAGVRLSRNYGHQVALSAGLTIARGDRILILDADLQDPPELLSEMMSLMDRGVDVVYGQRSARTGETRFKKLTASVFYRLLEKLVDVKIPVDTGDFRLMSRRALDVLNSMPEQHRFIRGMVSWIGLRQEPLIYERAARYAGSTKYPLTRMVRFAFDAVTGFSTQPLRLASYLGMLVGLFGLLLLIYVGIGWFRGKVVEGWTSLMVVVVSLASAQLMVIGIMGEYVGRLYVEAKRRPLFVIDEVIRSRAMAQNATVNAAEKPPH